LSTVCNLEKTFAEQLGGRREGLKLADGEREFERGDRRNRGS
jgi:hypothetical protein